MRLWFVDDDKENRKQFKELYSTYGRVEAFESCFDAHRAAARPDVVVIDCSACGAFVMHHAMYAPICSLIGKHPAAKYIVRSAMPIECQQAVVEDVRREIPETDIIAVAWNADLERHFISKATEAAGEE